MKTKLNQLTILFILLSCSVAASQSYFLKVTGPNVDGPSNQTGHLNEIILKDFEFSIINSVNINASAGAGKASSGPINLTFEKCLGATEFFKRLHNGENFDEFKISAQRTSGSGYHDYLIYTFKAVVVSNFSSSYSSEDEELTYQLSVKAGTLKIEYIPFNATGEPDTGNKKEAEWSFIHNEASENI
ncbi:type VI secretion system tube protein Hcp [Jiulongibacter sp. NS-SX5]|uniref:type VI secretion system tube protein Hcp n=1 Tax=Jiulongibacter sp. NS-SX5 TaxID=3463854 RepID=UPI004059DE8F